MAPSLIFTSVSAAHIFVIASARRKLSAKRFMTAPLSLGGLGRPASATSRQRWRPCHRTGLRTPKPTRLIGRVIRYPYHQTGDADGAGFANVYHGILIHRQAPSPF